MRTCGGTEEVPSTGSLGDHHCYAPAICSLLPRGLRQAPNICLCEPLQQVPGEWLQQAACSRARLELQVVRGRQLT